MNREEINTINEDLAFRVGCGFIGFIAAVIIAVVLYLIRGR